MTRPWLASWTSFGAALLPALAVGAELRFELPPGEAPADWEPVLQSVGLVAGDALEPPWARLATGEEGLCQLEVATSWGARLNEEVPCPRSSSEREEVASLAALMLEPLIRGERSLTSLPVPPVSSRSDDAPIGKRKLAERRAGGTHDQASGGSAASPGADSPPHFQLMDARARSLSRSTADAVLVETTASSPTGPAGTQVGDRLDASQPSAIDPTPPGTTQFNPLCYYTDCSVSFDRRLCSALDGCSTAEKCPDTYWLDFDHDGYGDPQTCLSLTTERPGGVPVQNVGDCDDRHSSVHPGAPEIIGDGIDNDCDGVAR